MTTIGERWLLKQQKAGIARQEEAEEEKRKAQETSAKKSIDHIPALIKTAVARGERSIKLYGWIGKEDVSGDDHDRVDALSKRRKTGSLHAEDLTGCARIIFDWCDANGLECFLEMQDIPMNECEYNLCARPKQG